MTPIKSKQSWWKENKGFLLFVGLMLFVRAGVADWYYVPTGSMEPSIEVGDRILVNKIAYDIKVPFSNITLTSHSAVERGDIVVFNSEAAQERLIKRVIGVAGDRVALINNRLIINGASLSYRRENDKLLEELPAYLHEIKLAGNPTPLSSFREITVPTGHLLVMGDNRNNSADSRVYGFVPKEEIIGKATSVLYSLDNQNYYLPKLQRTFHTLI
ncbi:signal peptidase I [Aestuariibacter sp. A3R04]|nr:signal peptidase I [Aestuariibacter sp. A3R04]MBU3023360.1 signal peptidase I [Aestuariibacter sp. A3R04]